MLIYLSVHQTRPVAEIMPCNVQQLHNAYSSPSQGVSVPLVIHVDARSKRVSFGPLLLSYLTLLQATFKHYKSISDYILEHWKVIFCLLHEDLPRAVWLFPSYAEALPCREGHVR